jgi:hypothetical protein
VPLPFVHQLAPIYLAGMAAPGSSWEDDRRVHAVARLLLQGAIDHVQLSWVKVGLERGVDLLRGGCDDLGGTLMEETISRMAGSSTASARTSPHRPAAPADPPRSAPPLRAGVAWIDCSPAASLGEAPVGDRSRPCTGPPRGLYPPGARG